MKRVARAVYAGCLIWIAYHVIVVAWDVTGNSWIVLASVVLVTAALGKIIQKVLR